MNNIYLIYGNDYRLIKKEIDKLSADATDVVKYDLKESKIDELLDDASCISLFCDKKVLIGENASFLTKELDGTDYSYLENYINDDSHDNVVIFTFCGGSLNVKNRIVKLLKNKAEVKYIQSVQNYDIPKLIVEELKEKGYKISITDASYFRELVGNDISIIYSEIEKLIIYKDDDKYIKREDISNIISKSYDESVFKLSNGIIEKNSKKIFEGYRELLLINEEPQKILALLAASFDKLYKVKILKDQQYTCKDIMDKLSMKEYPVKKFMSTDYRENEIIDMIKKLYQLDLDIKSGRKEKYNAIEMFLLSI